MMVRNTTTKISRHEDVTAIRKKGISRLAKCPAQLAAAFAALDETPESAKIKPEVKKFIRETLTFAARLVDTWGYATLDAKMRLGIEEGKHVVSPLSPYMVVLQALDGVEAGRIKVCGVCDKPFWAGRRDKQGCSPKHSRVLTMRRLRDVYKVQRQRARRKKSQKPPRQRAKKQR